MDDLWGTGRTEAFSDGVFAIAITLLILEVNVPETAFDNLWRGIADQWPSYLAYATSFITIGGIWLAHHGIFRRLQYANKPLMVVNLLLLMAVSFLPFPTKLMAEAIDSCDAERAAVIFYGAHAARHLVPAQRPLGLRCTRPPSPSAGGEREGVQRDRAGDDPEHRLLHRRDRAGLMAPVGRRIGYLAIAIVAVLRARGDRSGPPTPALSTRSRLTRVKRGLRDRPAELT